MAREGALRQLPLHVRDTRARRQRPLEQVEQEAADCFLARCGAPVADAVGVAPRAGVAVCAADVDAVPRNGARGTRAMLAALSGFTFSWAASPPSRA